MDERQRSGVGTRKKRGWLLLLVLPYLGLCFPQLYVRATPVLWGFPFFYWYQFVWVLLTSDFYGCSIAKAGQEASGVARSSHAAAPLQSLLNFLRS